MITNTINILFLLISFSFISIVEGKNYMVTISTTDGQIYEINFGSYYVELYRYEFVYAEPVLLKTNSFKHGDNVYITGKICWEEEAYVYFYNEYRTDYTDCSSIMNVYAPFNCSGCLIKDGLSIEEADEILKPVDLSEVIY